MNEYFDLLKHSYANNHRVVISTFRAHLLEAHCASEELRYQVMLTAQDGNDYLVVHDSVDQCYWFVALTNNLDELRTGDFVAFERFERYADALHKLVSMTMTDYDRYDE